MDVPLQFHWLLVLQVLLCYYAIRYAYKCFMYSLKKSRLKEKREEYKSMLKKSFLNMRMECQRVPHKVVQEITGLKFHSLRQMLQNGELTCLEVLQAYQKKALIENEKYNFIAHPIEESKEIAEMLDSLVVEDKAKLPLFGIPVSFKENFHVKGYAVTIGCSALIEATVNSTSPLYKSIVKAGAIPFIKTNISQTMKSFGAHNPIYGQTRNPLDTTRSPGGSSCGEAAAIASSSSILGFGNDLGGSVRVPAAWCGLHSLKPTLNRISSSHMSAVVNGQSAVRGTSGIMAQSMDAIIMAMKVLSTDFHYDADRSLPPIAFNENEYLSNRPLRVAYFTDWTSIPATESTKSTVRRVVANLASHGHTVFEWQPPTTTGLDPSQLLLTSFFADGGSQIRQKMHGDEVSYVIKPLMDSLSKPHWIKRYVSKIMNTIAPWWKAEKFIRHSGVRSLTEWFRHNENIEIYKRAWLEDWKHSNIDVLISPVVPIPAEVIDEASGCAPGCGTFTYLYNVIDFPAGVVPCEPITPDQEASDLKCYPDHNFKLKKLKQSIKGSTGLPLSVQVVTAPYKEELCLRVMNLIGEMNTKAAERALCIMD